MTELLRNQIIGNTPGPHKTVTKEERMVGMRHIYNWPFCKVFVPALFPNFMKTNQ
jgi:hypothetical protein